MVTTIDVEAILEMGSAQVETRGQSRAACWVPFVQADCGAVHLRAYTTAPRLVTVSGVLTRPAAATAAPGATNRATR